MTIPGHSRGDRARWWPHWLRHAWGDWVPGTHEQGNLIANYDYRNCDVRTCMLCGRRQMRAI